MNLICADVETTGFGPEARIVEVALTEIDMHLNVVAELHSLINPCISIPPSASAVHHITDGMVADAPTVDQFFGKLGGLCREPAVVIAHNAAFDIQYLGPYFHPDSTTLCTLRLVRHLYPDLENHKLQTLRYTFGLDAGRAHSADGDTLVLVNLLKFIAQDKGMTIAEMYDLARSPVPVKKMPFGKHRGSEIQALPKDYVKWALKNIDNLEPDLRLALEAAL